MFSRFSSKTRCLLWTALVGTFLTVLSLIFALVILPILMDNALADQLVIKEGSKAWDRFIALPFPIDLKVYFFEVTNKENFTNGSKPVLEQIGPFIYKTYYKKINIEQVDDEHVSYYTIQTYQYDHERSKFNDDYELHALNFLVLGLHQILENAIIDFNYDLDVILPNILSDTELFYKPKVHNFLFDGIEFCFPNVDDLLSKMVCLIVMLMNNKTITYNDDLTMSYSFLGWKNNTHNGKFVVNTGEKDISKLGQIQSWNDMKYTNIWQEGENDCNEVRGYDIGVFRPDIKKQSSFDVFSPDACRTLTMRYEEATKFRDIHVYKFVVDNNTWRTKNNCPPDESCFCSDFTRGLDGEKSCFMDGVQDVYPCIGIPGLVSFPHLLYADSKYSETVENLSPNQGQHASYMNMQPLSGAPLEGWVRLQVNLIIRPIKLREKIVKMTERLSRTMMPIMWFQQGVVINDEIYDTISTALTLLAIADIVKWVFVLISGLIFLYPASRLFIDTT